MLLDNNLNNFNSNNLNRDDYSRHRLLFSYRYVTIFLEN